MPNQPREYHRPLNQQSAVQLLRQTRESVSPLLLGPKPVALSNLNVEAVVDLNHLELDYITEAEDGNIHLGAMTPLQSLADSPLVQSMASGLLAEAAKLAASAGLRRLATLAGAILSADGPPEVVLAMLALDAKLVLQSETPREVLLADLLKKAGSSGEAFLPGEFLLEAKFPWPSGVQIGGALERVARTPRDEAIVAVAVVIGIQDEVCHLARLALAGTGPRPKGVGPAENLLEGRALTPELLREAADTARRSVSPVSDFRASAEYRRGVAGVLARRALETAWHRSQVASVP